MEWRIQGSIFRQLAVAIFVPGIIAVVFVAGLSHAVSFWPSLDWPWGPWGLDENAQLGYLTTLGQVSAGMLALYFTAISVVASTGYARVPNDIRSLILQDQIGNFYFRVLTQFAATTIVMLASLAFGMALGPLNIGLATALALFSILSFWPLGQRAFRQLDAATLTESLNRELAGAITAAAAPKFGWNESSLQAHNQRRGEHALQSYRNLIAIAAQQENVGGDQLVDLGRSLLKMLAFYAGTKQRIPSKSYWFKRINRHKDWLTASVHELDIALATDSSLPPDQVPDLLWFERVAAGHLEEVASELGRRKDYPGLAQLADSLHRTMDVFGRNCAVDEGMLVARIAGAPILRHCREVDFSSVPEADFVRVTYALAALEYQSCALIEAFLGLVRILDHLSVGGLEQRIRTINWKKPETVYAGDSLPRPVIEQMEWVQECLDFEGKLEGEAISPEWLRVEMSARGMVRFLHQSVAAILDEMERAFAPATTGASAQAIVDAENCLWGLEACNKLENHLQRYEHLSREHALKNRSREYQWPETDWPGAQQRIAALRKRLVVKLGERAAALAQLPDGGTWPDYFGRSYSMLGDQAFDALVSGDEALFVDIFPRYFACTFVAIDRIGKKASKDTRTHFLQSRPLRDLLDLSGYALLFSSLDGKPFSAVVTQAWDQHFAARGSDVERAVLAAGIVLLCEPSLWLAGDAPLQMRWHYGTDRVLRSRGIRTERYGGYGDDAVITHASPLVRAFALGSTVMFESHDIFLSLYLYARADLAGLNKTSAVQFFERELQRQDNNPSQGS